MNYQEYKKDFLEDLRNESAISGSDTEDEFLNRSLDILVDFEEVEDPLRINMGDKRGKGGRIMHVDGYCFDDTEQSLILFISDFQDSYDTDKLTMSRVDELYWRAYYFLDEVCNGNIENYFDESDDIIKISRLIRKRMNSNSEGSEILKVKFYIMTNKELDTKLLSTNLLETTIKKGKKKATKTKSNKKIKKDNFNDKPLEINLWHLERLFEMENSNNNDPIVIDIKSDFPDLGYKGIPCIKGNIGENLGYDAYIAIIPGDLLAQIYIDHGSKVLEGNVRAFLGSGGKKSVNQGIKSTINNEPTKFFTYNNGIATTASDVEIVENEGQHFITKIVDLQIINGGQTTASLATAALKNKDADFSNIFVPMKLTVIEDRESENEDGIRFYDDMVQKIARYANKQNKVTDADFFSNDPFHIWMEKKSKTHLAPPSKYNIPTGWYYERSRKRYQQEQFKLSTADSKRFELKFPKKQVITKEQLAVYLTALNCKPHIVSRGKSKVIREFGDMISSEYSNNREKFNDLYFERCICAAIVFRTVDGYLETNKDSARKPTGFWYKAGGYKLNIVPYTIAKIISCIPKGYSLDWNKIWQNQSLSPAFMREIEKLTKITNDFICDSHGIIVTEYCKHEDTWKNFRDTVKYDLSEDFLSELIPEDLIKEAESAAKSEQKETNDLQIAMDVIKLTSAYWSKLFQEALSRGLMTTYQEQTAVKQVIQMASTFTVPTSKSGKVPTKTMNNIKIALDVKGKLEAEGITL